MPIRGVIFDYGGVIAGMNWHVGYELEEQHGLERGVLFRTLYRSDEWRAVQVGKGDVDAWREAAHRQLEEAAGRSLPRLHEQWRATIGLIPENMELIRALRPPYRLAVLSNADSTLENRMRDGLGIYYLFDTVICSAVVGMAKPDPRIYKLAAERLGIPANECVFIDDLEDNVTAAREVGMAGVHYRVDRGHDLAAQLSELGVAPTSAG